MQTTVDAQNAAVSPAKTAAAAKTKSGRLLYLDTLRVILIIAVIALHTAIAYGGGGDWTYEDPRQDEVTSIVLNLVTGLVQSFSLGLYFFVAGYFTPGPYDRKGVLRFWKDRLLRLGIPLVLYTWVFSIVTRYFAALGKGTFDGSFWAYFAQEFIVGADEGPTWFIFSLLLFSFGYTIWRWISRLLPPEKLAWTARLDVPGKKQILGLGLVVAVLMFLVGLVSPVGDTIEAFGIFGMMVVFYIQYILFYVAGVLAFRNDWLTRFDGRQLRFWSWLALGLFITLPVVFGIGMALGSTDAEFMGGFTWQAAAFMLWVGLFSVSISMTLILWLRDRKQPAGRLVTFANPNSYAVYLIHPIVLVAVTVAFSYLALPPALKYVIVLPLVVSLCFLIADGLRRIPGVKAIL